MKVKSSPAAKRKRATMQQPQADPALRSLIEDVVAGHPSVKKVLVIDVGGTSVKILPRGRQKPDRFSLDQSSRLSAWFRE